MVVKTAEKPKKVQKRLSGREVDQPKKKRFLWVIKIQCLPFGFFEKELLGYFQQFGTVIRVRVARSIKTGNHKGWAYVGFDNKEVAEIAAETMNGYLMFEHRLIVKVMKPTSIPKSMLSGPVTVNRPARKGFAKRDAIKRNNATSDNDKAAFKRRQRKFIKRMTELTNLGIQYDFDKNTPKKAVTHDIQDNDVQVVPAPAKTPKTVKITEPKKTPQSRKIEKVENTPKFSPKTRAGKAKAAASAVSTPAQTSAISKAIMKSVAASARPAALEKRTPVVKRGKKKSL